jgi:hypothetical protein
MSFDKNIPTYTRLRDITKKKRTIDIYFIETMMIFRFFFNLRIFIIFLAYAQKAFEWHP